jgi:hypothetical protein
MASDGKAPYSFNWTALLDQVRIDYESAPAKGLPHGLQKEAIQNGWGARRTSKGSGWGFAFRLTPAGKHRFLTMTDFGTHGLTGDVDFDPTKLPDNESIPDDQRLVRFQSVYESGGEGPGPGSFGRGKFIFNLASKERLIYYDSLLANGEYRLGSRRIKGREFLQPKVLTGDEAEAELQRVTHNQLSRLDAPGTRIIVVDPVSEVIEALESGEFARAIGETWWEIIQKYSATITVQVEPASQVTAEIPADFGGFPDKSAKGWKVFSKEHIALETEGEKLRVKRLHFLIAPSSHTVGSDLLGVIVHRRGMAIGQIKLSGLPTEIADRFFGYVQLEPELENALIAAGQEHTTHYGFVLPRRLPYRQLQQVVQNHFDEFLESLGLKTTVSSEERQRRLADEAQSELNKILNSLGVPGFGTGTSQADELLLSVEDLVFPRGSNEVTRGDSISGFRFRLENVGRKENAVWWRVYTYERDSGEIETLMERSICKLAAGAFTTTKPFQISLDSRYPSPAKVGCVCEVSDGDGKVLARKTFFLYLDLPRAVEPELAKIHLRLATWPRPPSRRVDYDESIKALLYEVENMREVPMKIRLRLRTLWADESNAEIAEIGSGWMMELGPHQAKSVTVPEVLVGRADYQEIGRGKINLRMHAVALEGSKFWEKGDRVAEHTIPFFLNMDPNYGFFDPEPEWNQDGENSPRSRAKSLEGVKTWKLSINTLHPAYRSVEADPDAFKDYLFEQMARQTVFVLLKTGHGEALAKQADISKKEDVFEMSAPDLVQRIEFAVTDKILARYYKG